MKYIDELDKERALHHCPFCHISPKEIIYEGKYFLVVPARAPYTKDHLLIIPKRHVNLLATLKKGELSEMHTFLHIWTEKLHKTYTGVSLLLRDGFVSDPILQKSVNHFHFHLLPNMAVEILDQKSSQNRERLDDTTYDKVAQTLKKKFL